MAKKKDDSPKAVLERTYNIPLRKEYQKAPRWNRTKKAVSAVRVFLAKHMKSETVKVGRSLNEELWKHGIKNPPHHIKVTAVKDDKGVVRAELFGMKAAEESRKPVPAKEKKKQAGQEKEVSEEQKEPEPKEKGIDS